MNILEDFDSDLVCLHIHQYECTKLGMEFCFSRFEGKQVSVDVFFLDALKRHGFLLPSPYKVLEIFPVEVETIRNRNMEIGQRPVAKPMGRGRKPYFSYFDEFSISQFEGVARRVDRFRIYINMICDSMQRLEDEVHWGNNIEPVRTDCLKLLDLLNNPDSELVDDPRKLP